MRSTVADNGGTGVRAEFHHGGGALLASSALQGNGDDVEDVVGAGVFSASHCNVGDGDFAGQAGCFSEPPGFANPAAGDYRLRFGSACVDRGDPADVGELPDLSGVLRPLDGDLDTARVVDVGCYELATLRQQGSAWPGGTVELLLLGPQGASSALYFSSAGLAPVPLVTVFGLWHLPLPPASRLVGVFGVSPWPPAQVSLPVPPSPSLVGQQVAFQGLTNSTGPGSARAATSPQAVTIVAAP